MHPIPQWPVMMYYYAWPEHSRYQDDLRQVCRDLEQRQHHSGVSPEAKQGLYESGFDFVQQDSDAVKSWSAWAKDCVFQSAQHACGTAWPPGMNVAIELHESWCHITRDGGYHDVHIHPNSSWSGIYYLDCGDMDITTKNGINRFFRPHDTAYTDAGTTWMTQNNTIDINAQSGRMIVFPSWIQHSALPYRGGRERFILSFNSRVKLAR
jgi:uncharacterized protein (TIGR02466 family)